MYEQRSSSETNNPLKRYCICQKLENELHNYDGNNSDFMIECDGCHDWFHGHCISLNDRIADDIENYFCAKCSDTYGPSIFKQRKNQHRRDFSDENAKDKPIQSGTKDFIAQLKTRTFLNCEPVLLRMKGNQLTHEYLIENGFTKPILISNRDGLDLMLPDRTITLKEISELVGHDCVIDAIDSEKQVTYKMRMDEYVQYFENFDRQRIYNVLSLEISKTRLGELITIPKIVRDISWATIFSCLDENRTNKSKVNFQTQMSIADSEAGDDDDDDDDLNENHFETSQRPDVAKYCLMSPQSSYTDFHIDFGGSSVWYTVVRGEKIFYLIEPTDENLQKYIDWSNSLNASEMFFGDCVSHCYKMHLREDNTVFIPAGWIHAVYTVTDSLVFGGNFLQSMGVDMQLRIYEMECLAQVPQKFKYPLFETYHWYVAKQFYDELRESNSKDLLKLDRITVQAIESMIYHMNRWLSIDKRYQIRNRYIIPKNINCEKLLRELARALDIAKTRCGYSCSFTRPSKLINFNSRKRSIEDQTKNEYVQIGNKKIKVKCRRLSSDSKLINNTKSTFEHGMKLIIKTSNNKKRKQSKKNIISTKKSNHIPDDSFSHEKNKSVIVDENLTTRSSNDIELNTENHNESLVNCGLASFIPTSLYGPIHNDTKQTDLPSKKSKSKMLNTDKNRIKKLKTNSIKRSVKDGSKTNSNDRIKKLLKLANNIKLRNSVLS